MSRIIMAIEPDAAYREWARQVEYHLGLVPKLLGAALALSAPDIPVSRGGSQFDRPQITGGGYFDQIPVGGGGGTARAAGDATYLWSMLAEYATAVSEWLNAPTRIPPKCPSTSRSAHDAALVIVGTLIDHAALIWEHRSLDAFEQEMFREVRRQQRHLLPQHDGIPQHARDCTTCGEQRTVRVAWVDGANGSPKPVQVGKCTTCGQVYRQNEGESDE